MDGAMAALKTEFSSLRTGRASASMLDPIMVDAYGSKTPLNQVGTVNVPEPRMVTVNISYGSKTPLNQVGTVNVPEPRMVTVNIWDKSLVQVAEKAIRESGLGINPQLNGTIIMLPIPELNEERRRTRNAAAS